MDNDCLVTVYPIYYEVQVLIQLAASCRVAAGLVARLSVSQLSSYFEYLDVMIEDFYGYACSMNSESEMISLCTLSYCCHYSMFSINSQL